jgi:16S rRNA (cytidine1402-2'-O)-methyltransferase
MPGTLYIVSTPIGNLNDITFRAVEVLKQVDLIACEDTRRTKILLEKFGLAKNLISYYNYNERQRAEEIIRELKSGKNVALVSDSGTPGISDPGFVLIKRAIEENITVIPIPGPSAFVCALVGSGLPMDEFVFVGFLPHKKGRKTKLKKLSEEERTIILYESPHRLIKTLNEILENFGDREIAVAKELTKIHEEFFRGKISEVLKKLTPDKIKGEFVIVISGKTNYEV